MCVCVCVGLNFIPPVIRTCDHSKFAYSYIFMNVCISNVEKAHLKEVPQVHEEAGEHELLCFGDEAVGHEAEVLHQFGCAVHRHVHVELGPSQQTQQEVIDLQRRRKRQQNHT